MKWHLVLAGSMLCGVLALAVQGQAAPLEAKATMASATMEKADAPSERLKNEWDDWEDESIDDEWIRDRDRDRDDGPDWDDRDYRDRDDFDGIDDRRGRDRDDVRDDRYYRDRDDDDYYRDRRDDYYYRDRDDNDYYRDRRDDYYYRNDRYYYYYPDSSNRNDLGIPVACEPSRLEHEDFILSTGLRECVFLNPEDDWDERDDWGDRRIYRQNNSSDGLNFILRILESLD